MQPPALPTALESAAVPSASAAEPEACSAPMPPLVSVQGRQASTALQLRSRLALYAAAATLLWLLERTLPNPVPWIRLGLANGVTLLVLLEHGAVAAGIVLVLRLFLAAFFAGTLFGPQSILALGGGVASWAAMTLAQRWGGRLLSPLGLSVLGASAHGLAQLALVATVLGAGSGAWDLLPLFAIVALASGSCTGIVVDALQARLALARGTAAP